MAITGCDVCSDACDNEPLCMSYECSAVQLRCNLNTQTWPDGYPSSNADYEDFAFCVKLQPCYDMPGTWTRSSLSPGCYATTDAERCCRSSDPRSDFSGDAADCVYRSQGDMDGNQCSTAGWASSNGFPSSTWEDCTSILGLSSCPPPASPPAAPPPPPLLPPPPPSPTAPCYDVPGTWTRSFLSPGCYATRDAKTCCRSSDPRSAFSGDDADCVYRSQGDMSGNHCQPAGWASSNGFPSSTWENCASILGLSSCPPPASPPAASPPPPLLASRTRRPSRL